MSLFSNTQQIIIIYHGFCTDGFGAAYSAWKKFGNNATYIAYTRDMAAPTPLELAGKDVYIVDYCFSEVEMKALEMTANSFMVIDHHFSAKDAVESLKSHIFNNERSGAYLAWQYFHPEIKVPKLIEYISDADTWSHSIPSWKEIESFIYNNGEEHFSFEHFEKLHTTLETEEGFARAFEIGAMLVTGHQAKVNMYAEMAEIVTFEGYEIYAVNAPREVRSELGHVLAEKTNSFSLIFTYEQGKWKCSLRSVKDFDVSPLATKYGGGGHKNAAAFMVQAGFPLPFIK